LTAHNSYTVLARKYRPADFSSLIGQEALVRIISNAIKLNKVPHAFLLTGIRGVGKTTTARIIAKVLNCIGEDGKADGPTATPCLKCANCREIGESRHPDIIEMDAASKTGVDDIREVIENCSYSPVSARYKIYIIDEVHMLSNNAFNALLKTLEEPPAHVKFIFATTEVRKLPLTIISRCQRFDLKKVGNKELVEFLGGICQKEEIKYTEKALKLLTNLSGGSVRDSLSLLDQIITLTDRDIKEDAIRSSLGLTSKTKLIDLYSLIIEGNAAGVLTSLQSLLDAGGIAKQILHEILEITHYLSKYKVSKSLQDIEDLDQDSQDKIIALSDKASMSALTIIWQMLLKGTQELTHAWNQDIALEMLIIRILHIDKELGFSDIFTQKEENILQAQDLKKKVLN
jgi:DNA polymerase III subunit gamma/tau